MLPGAAPAGRTNFASRNMLGQLPSNFLLIRIPFVSLDSTHTRAAPVRR
jgi:hypothetical protein